MNSAALIQRCCRRLGAGGDAATEGQCCSSAGAPKRNMEDRSSGNSMYGPRVIAACLAPIQSSVISQQADRQHDIDHFS